MEKKVFFVFFLKHSHESKDGETPQFDRIMPAIVEPVLLPSSSLCQVGWED